MVVSRLAGYQQSKFSMMFVNVCTLEHKKVNTLLRLKILGEQMHKHCIVASVMRYILDICSEVVEQN